ncbi:tetratricopeptide repeat protein [Paraliomyxa miuraensis]|uniref:tetratricopeptide repeat protein n=1 Tax=Paraliomyxa miuraensis TaxID=376150 RepID=UPI002259AF27|nr:tetratricopeptide repeat protein [Paraliomyxa miuraensis]MCX4239217.1 tetratricopeptide repeat protein [Paraliomyxa miuraensis]
MRNTNRIIGLMTLSLALGVGACGKNKNGKTNNPGGGGAAAAAAIDPTKASAEAKKDFAAVAQQYAAAKAKGSLSAGQCDQFSKDFESVYRKHGQQMTVAYFNAGAVWDECGDVEKAEQIYQGVIKAVPKYDLSYNNLGVIYWNRNQEEKALDYFKKAVDANIATRAPRNNLAAALRNKYANSPDQKLFEDAEKTLQRVLAVDSSNQLAYENLARLYYDRGRLKDKSYLLLAGLVIKQATEVLKKDNIESADLFNLTGLLLMERDDQVEALKAFKKAAEINPKHADAHMNMALIAINFRDYKTAEDSLSIAIKDQRQKKNVEAYLGLGVAQRGLRKYKEAEASFKKAMDISKSDPRPLYNLGILYHEHIAATQEGDFDKAPYNTAKEYYNKFVSKAGGNSTFAPQVDDAKNRVVAIDQLFKDIEEMKKLEAEQKAMEELAKKQQEEEKKRLLDLEAKAKAAASGGAAAGGDAGGGGG